MTLFSYDELLSINPTLAFAVEEISDPDEKEDDCGCGTGCGCEESSGAATPNEYIFSNPDEATKKAKEMGLDGIHSHKDGEKTVFMPGPSHEALMKKLDK